MMASAAAKPATRPGQKQKKKKQIYDVNVTIDLVSEYNYIFYIFRVSPGRATLQFSLIYFSLFFSGNERGKITNENTNPTHEIKVFARHTQTK